MLVGMQAGAATLENSMEVVQKTKNRTTLQPRNCTTKNLFKETGVLIRRGTWTPRFIAALSTIAKLQKEPKCLPTDEWIKKLWFIYTMEYYLAMKKNEIWPFVATWMGLESVMLSEISHTENDKYHMFSLLCGS